MSKRKHYLVYQIDDNLNKKIYIGVHVTQKVNDGYMGSGVALNKAIKEYGIENFSKTILYDFDDKEAMLNKEAELVNEEFIKRFDTYNIILGGGFITTGHITVKDGNGCFAFVSLDDPRYLSGELTALGTNKTTVIDDNNETFQIDVNDPRYVTGELKNANCGYFTAVCKLTGDRFYIRNDDPRYLSGELVHIQSNMVTVKDTNGNVYCVDKNDPRYTSGELVGITKGVKLTREHIMKIKKNRNTDFQTGKNNSQYNTMWIYNDETLDSMKIKKTDTIPVGWRKGRKIKKQALPIR